MCTSRNSKLQTGGLSVDMTPPNGNITNSAAGGSVLSHINGRPVLQPACNRVVPLMERRNSLKKTNSTVKSSTTPLSKPKIQPLSSSPPPTPTRASATTPPISPKLKSPRLPAVKRGNVSNSDPNGLNCSVEKLLMNVPTTKSSNGNKSVPVSASAKKSKKCSSGALSGGGVLVSPPPAPATPPLSPEKISSSLIVEAPGSIAAARREQVAIMQVQRKMRIAHYGRTKSARFVSAVDSSSSSAISAVREEKKCSFITANSDPIYIAYHDEEWGVPVHDDQLLFELLVLTGAQVGSDWTSVLKKRQAFRDAFSGFDAGAVSKFSEKKMTSIAADYGIDLSQVRGVVDNAIRILEIKKEMGTLDKYLWGFVNNKAIATQYRASHKIPVKTSKSEGISKDLVRRGFRFVGPTVIHSFMQAAGLTNDHLLTCPRHLQCLSLFSSSSSCSATSRS